MALSDSATCTIDDVGPCPVVRPASVAELGDTVRRAVAEQRPLVPLGGRTMLGVGNPPARPGLGVELTQLAALIDYPARDMTITVQAGITLARLQETLRAEGQRLPIDVPQPERATLGGVLAVNVSGSRRLGFGTLRDYVIGISTINDEGQETKAGGRVVKNVAGYDLCKLHIGALGTLGVISQVTLKLKPLPEETALVLCRCATADLGSVLDALHATRTRPVSLDVLNPRAAAAFPGNAGSWAIAVGLEESGATVRWQVQQLLQELSAVRTRDPQALLGPATAPLWQQLSEFQLRPAAELTFKANLLPHAVADFCRTAEGRAPSLELLAHAGSGVVIGHVSGDLAAAQALLRTLQEEASKERGNVVVRQCPVAWKKALPLWGAPRGDAALMAAVRDKLDPRRVFNPGRFLV